ncbi:ATP-grasp domain-containing protein [Clostridium sp. D43t1_170807_H7]|uniref:ATP-grasp domain-containing protein n=1 Tax=Clostridium sp. D43t1_170807_H7 TaxID=2787140 RepID=UPI0018998FAF|nr:ATP-grasp domain-containing protein [Clostridium sp. D43t1_170807_H7]
MEINILILSAGRRVELIKCFKEAAKIKGIKSNIIAADMSKTAPATYFADKSYMIPMVDQEGYIESIIDICNKEKIKLIVPTIDTELRIISVNKALIEERTKAKVLISDKRVIDICRNKKNTNRFFEKNGFGVPREISENDINEENYNLPLFIKPLDGSSSINAFKINNKRELEFFKDYIKEPIIQECIEGKEYTIDAFIDFDGQPITIVPRERIATRSGEISKGKIIKDRELIDEVKEVIEVLKPIGHITFQCMKTNEGIKFIEINPRFGGGAPMSIKAGANSPLNLYKLLLGEKISYNEDYEDNMIALRFDDCIFLNSDGALI